MPSQFTPPWDVGTYNSANGLLLTMPDSGVSGNTALTYSYATNLYREPTVLMQPNIPAGSNLALDANNAMAVASPAWSNGIPELSSNQTFVGFYAGSVPSSWTLSNTTYTGNGTFTSSNGSTTLTTTRLLPGSGEFTISMEYQVGSTWISYEQVCVNNGFMEPNSASAPCDAVASSTDTRFMYALNPRRWTSAYSQEWCVSYPWDPRSRRWQTVGTRPYGPFLNTSINTISSQRAGASPGGGNYGSVFSEIAADNKIGYLAAGGSTWNYFKFGTWPTTSLGHYYFVDQNGYSVDADGVLRLGMAAAYTGNSTTNGLPLATPAAPSSRPIILHRPFRNVGELGYVFSDTPWRNIDFATPQSGCSALLDIFCIQENARSDAVVSGKVDLNTRQTPVIRALIAQGCRDELALTAGTDSPLSAVTGEADSLATRLVARTSATATGLAAPGPLRNLGDLVGRWISGAASAPDSQSTTMHNNITCNGSITPQPVYDGFSADIASYYTASNPTSVTNRVQRLRDAPIRALANSGQIGAWNLLIDIVVQTGKLNNADQFQVQGETRYWVHLAIDRLTGKVLEKNIERVNE